MADKAPEPAPGDDDAQGVSDVQEWTRELTGHGHETTIGDDGGDVASGWLTGGAIMVALAANYIVFSLLGVDYVHWFVASGKYIALALTVFSLAVSLDQEPGVISAHPSEYLGGWQAFFGSWFLWLGILAAREAPDGSSIPFWDDVVAIGFVLAGSLAALAWIVIVVPAQYCVALVCGAPARLTMSTPREVVIRPVPAARARSRRSVGSPDVTQINIGLNIRERPVTATAAISAAVLFALGFFV